MDSLLIVRLFRVVALGEACTWAGLLVGMYLKHAAGTTEAGVHLFGPLHGAFFMAYVAVALATARRLGWNAQVTGLALLASVPPLATAIFDAWASRRGLFARVA